MPLKATLYRSSKESNVRADLTFVESTLKELSEQNKLEYIIVDTADMTDAELTELYIKHYYHQFGTSIGQDSFWN